MNLLLTGASGFLGSALLQSFIGRSDVRLYPVYRGGVKLIDEHENLHAVVVNQDFESYSWSKELQNIDVIVHVAGRAHVLNAGDQLREFRRANLDVTMNLARQAAACGVKRFVFISSIGVNGGGGLYPYTELDCPSPENAYAISKFEAEQALQELAQSSSMEVVIIRPPLIYGFGAPGNFSRLVSAVKRGVPLPFGSVQNKRTCVGIDNLTDLIHLCVYHPSARNQIFLAGDNEDVSIEMMIRTIAEGLGRPTRLLNVPLPLLNVMVGLMGKRQLLDKICGNLQVDIGKARKLLSWSPRMTVREGLLKAVRKEHD